MACLDKGCKNGVSLKPQPLDPMRRMGSFVDGKYAHSERSCFTGKDDIFSKVHRSGNATARKHA
jgi:hypothetical protein